MKSRIIVIVLAVMLVSGYTTLNAQSDIKELNAIKTVVPFLTVAPDSRAGGMGDAGVATSPDLFSIHWNPSKIAFIDGKAGVGISYIPWLRNLVPDINIAYLTGYKRLDKKQVLSSSLLYSSLGNIEFTDGFGEIERTYKPNEFAFDAAYSRLLSDHFSGGIAFRFIYSNLTGGSYSGGIATQAGIAFAADISGYYQNKISLLGKETLLSFGLNLSNIGSKMNYSNEIISDFIPMNMRIGTAFALELDDFNKFSFTIELNKLLVPTTPAYSITQPDSIIAGKDPNVSVPVAIFQSFIDAPNGFKEELNEITFSGGLEYWYNNQFALRAGYFYEDQSKGNRKFFTAGAGFRLNSFTMDFSYLMPSGKNHPLARTLRFTLLFNINTLKNTTSKKGLMVGE